MLISTFLNNCLIKKTVIKQKSMLTESFVVSRSGIPQILFICRNYRTDSKNSLTEKHPDFFSEFIKVNDKAFFIDKGIKIDYILSGISKLKNILYIPALESSILIKELFQHDKKLLIQYSKVYFYSNPVTADRDKLEEEFREIEFVW